MYGKVKVLGDEAAPLFRWLKANAPEDKRHEIKWNFNKFLVDTNGNVVDRFELLCRTCRGCDCPHREPAARGIAGTAPRLFRPGNTNAPGPCGPGGVPFRDAKV